MRTLIFTTVLAAVSYHSVDLLLQQNIVKNIQEHNKKIEIALGYTIGGYHD